MDIGQCPFKPDFGEMQGRRDEAAALAASEHVDDVKSPFDLTGMVDFKAFRSI